ncbi:unnamed protein product, partial [Heterosigma akashiwo]
AAAAARRPRAAGEHREEQPPAPDVPVQSVPRQLVLPRWRRRDHPDVRVEDLVEAAAVGVAVHHEGQVVDARGHLGKAHRDLLVVALARARQVVPAVLHPRELQLLERDRPRRVGPEVLGEHQAGGVQVEVGVGRLPAAAQAHLVEGRRHGRHVVLLHHERALEAEHPFPHQVRVQETIHRLPQRGQALLEVPPLRGL